MYLLTAPTRKTDLPVLYSSEKYSSSAHSTPKLCTKQFVQKLSGFMLTYSKVPYDLHVRVHDVLNTQICLKIGFWGLARPGIVDYKVLTRPTSTRLK